MELARIMDTSRKNPFMNFVVSSYNACAAGIHFLYRKLIEPKSNTEDTRRHELILNTLLAGSVGLILIYWAIIVDHVIVLGPEYQGVPLILFSAIAAFFIGLLVLSRSGKFVVATHGLITVFLAGATYGAIHFGADLQAVLLAYVLTIFIAGILVSARYGLIITIVISTALLVIWRLQITGVMVPQWYWKYEPAENNSFEFVVMFFLIMLVSWLSNREIERSLKRARSSEAALKQERDYLEIRVEERTRELKEAQAEKVSQLAHFAEFGKLSSSIFHDLMNPLNAVVANVSRIDSNPEHIPEVRTYLEKAVVASRRMGDLLDTARRQLRPSTTNESFSLNNEIEEAIDLMRYKARQVEVSLSFDAQQELRTFGNAYLFHQIALNLISNALDAYAEITRTDTRTVSITLTEQAGSAILTVTDHGCGMSPETKTRVFDQFFTTKPHGKGLGIGLATAYQNVTTEFAGSIDIQTEHGKGSSFIVTIPLTSAETST